MKRVDKLIQAGEELLDSRHLAQAARCFEEAVAAVIGSGDKPSARLLSSWGYTMAFGLHEYARGLEVCRKAVEKEPADAELLSRLGSIYLACGDRRRAYQVFSLGLLQDPRHTDMRERLVSLGVRKRPPVPFLSRRHFVNRTLGRLRARYPRLFSGL
jgi:tetratricopeptide (TPR) repeat protein